MVNRRGQIAAEFVVVMGLLTGLGIFLAYTWIGSSAQPGISPVTVTNAVTRIQKD